MCNVRGRNYREIVAELPMDNSYFRLILFVKTECSYEQMMSGVVGARLPT